MDSENKRRVVREISGTVISVNKDGVVIQPDDEKMGQISNFFKGRDYSKFKPGQRVVHRVYSCLIDDTKEGNTEGIKNIKQYKTSYDYVILTEEELNGENQETDMKEQDKSGELGK